MKREPRAKVSEPVGQLPRKTLSRSSVGLSAGKASSVFCTVGPLCVWIMENETATHKHAEIGLCSSFYEQSESWLPFCNAKWSMGFLADEGGRGGEEEKVLGHSGKFLKRKRKKMCFLISFFMTSKRRSCLSTLFKAEPFVTRILPPVLLIVDP